MGTAQKDDKERVQTLLRDTVTLLCKNGLSFSNTLKVQGLLGITLDNSEVFLVQLDEGWERHAAGVVSSEEPPQVPVATSSGKRRKRRKSSEGGNAKRAVLENVVKIEPDDFVLLESDDSCGVDAKSPPGVVDFSNVSLGLDYQVSSGPAASSSRAREQGDPPYITSIVPNCASSQSGCERTRHPSNDTSRVPIGTIKIIEDSYQNEDVLVPNFNHTISGQQEATGSQIYAAQQQHSGLEGELQKQMENAWDVRPLYMRYTKEDAASAAAAVTSGSMTLYRAARVFGVPKTTLRRHVVRMQSGSTHPQQDKEPPASVTKTNLII